jgi:apolipoprotein D and lipocalin family protein
MSNLCLYLEFLRKVKKSSEFKKGVTSMKLLMALMFIASCAFAGGGNAELNTVNFVDVKKYLGKWYEIEKIPNSFQRKCGATQANYSLKKNGRVRVINKCKRLKDGKIKIAKGVASIENSATNAELEVSFFFVQRWFSGSNYFILDLADDYSYALVGSPSRDFLWILSRTPELDENIINNLKAVAEREGFDTSRMKKTPTWK